MLTGEQNKIIKTEIITIGTELLLGDIVNTNASIIAKNISQYGIDLFYITAVGDNLERLVEVIRRARERSDLIITTGGLGPTSDDITRQAIALAFECPFKADEYGQKLIIQYLQRRGRNMPAGVFTQALCPTKGKLIFNPMGSAPGIHLEDEGKTLIALPGVTKEMIAMLEAPVASILQGFSQDSLIHSKFLKVYGRGEPYVEDSLRDLIDQQTNPTIAPLASTGEVLIRLTCKASSLSLAQMLLKPFVQEIQKRLGSDIYGYDEDTMESVVASLARANNLTIAFAESCTGGLLAHRLTDIPGSSQFFLGGVVAYNNELKEKLLQVKPSSLESFGAVSREVALEMAQGLREVTAADICLAVTGIAGPTGASKDKPVGTICFACVTADSAKSELKNFFQKDRASIKMVSATHGFDIIRRTILNNKGC